MTTDRKRARMWRWSNSKHRPVPVECVSTGRPEYVFVPDPDDTMGGQIVSRSSLHKTEKEAYEEKIKDARRSVEFAQRQLDALERQSRITAERRRQ